MNKAFCAFHQEDSKQRCTVATGNWGCGAFGGNPAVKFLVQLMAASQAERPIFYFTFDDLQFARLIHEVTCDLSDDMFFTLLMFIGYFVLVPVFINFQ